MRTLLFLFAVLSLACAAQAGTPEEAAFISTIRYVSSIYKMPMPELQQQLKNDKKRAAASPNSASDQVPLKFTKALLADLRAPSEARTIEVLTLFVARIYASPLRTPPPSTLSPIEEAAILLYSNDDYQQLNRSLRSGTPAPGQEAFAAFLNQALGKLPNFEGTVKRGASLSPEDLEKMQPGFVFQKNEFFSTTADLDLNSFEQDVRLFIRSKTGKEISGYSSIPAEKEVLFRAGTKFRVLSVKQNVERAGRTASYEIELEEVMDSAGAD